MRKLIQRLSKRRNERGSAEVISMIFVMPFLLFLILALIDVSLFMNTKTSVQNVTRDAVRQAASWGGTASTVRLNPTGLNTAQLIKNRLYNSSTGKCTYSNCISPPVVTCTPAKASTAGTDISCTVTYKYKTVVPGSDLLGFSSLTSGPSGFTITEHSITETGYKN